MLPNRWFKDSLKFACTKCGNCCKGKTNVFMNVSEAEAIANHLSLSKFDFIKRFTEEKQTLDGLLTSLKSSTDKSKQQSCIFLKDNQCSIYDVRPTQCRTYPFWPQHLIGKAEWRAEARNCEGIATDESVMVDTVPEETVLSNLVVSMVHNRGLGPEWTYEESMSNLEESRVQHPEIMVEFENDFFSSHFSHIRYEKDNILVVDSTTPAAVNAANGFGEVDNADGTDSAAAGSKEEIGDEEDQRRVDALMRELTKPLEESENDDNDEHEHEHSEKVNAKLSTFRRMEFINLPNVTQSEVKLIPIDRSAQSELGAEQQYAVDHSSVTLPVHRAIADLVLNHVVKLHMYNRLSDAIGNSVAVVAMARSRAAQRDSSMNIALIGAGGCVLPNHLLHSIEQRRSGRQSGLLPSSSSGPSSFLIPKLRIDAVEPSGAVLNVAQAFFDTHFDSQTLIPHETDGVTFLQAHNDTRARGSGDGSSSSNRHFDLVIIDAFESTKSQSRAPPESLLDSHKAVRDALLAKPSPQTSSSSSTCSQHSGFLIVNVFGDGEWLRHTLSQYSAANGFCKPVVVVVGHSDVRSDNNYLVITAPIDDHGAIKDNLRPPSTGGDSHSSCSSSTTSSSTSRHHGSGITRMEELINSLLISGSASFSSQVVNDGHIFVFNNREEKEEEKGGDSL